LLKKVTIDSKNASTVEANAKIISVAGGGKAGGKSLNKHGYVDILSSSNQVPPRLIRNKECSSLFPLFGWLGCQLV